MLDLKELTGKEVKVWMKNKFYHQGKLISFTDEGIVIDDKKKGTVFLSLSNISSIEKFERWERW